MYIVLMLILFIFIIVLPSVKNKKTEDNKIDGLKLNENEKVLFIAKKNPYVSMVFAGYLIVGILLVFLGIAAFFESGVEQLYSNFSETSIFLLRIGAFIGGILIIRGYSVYMPIDKQSKFDMLVATDKRIFYNKTSKDLQLKEILPNTIKNVFVKRNSNSLSKVLVIETENEIITFPCFDDVDNLNNILNSIFKAKNGSI